MFHGEREFAVNFFCFSVVFVANFTNLLTGFILHFFNINYKCFFGFSLRFYCILAYTMIEVKLLMF